MHTTHVTRESLTTMSNLPVIGNGDIAMGKLKQTVGQNGALPLMAAIDRAGAQHGSESGNNPARLSFSAPFSGGVSPLK